MKSKDLKPTRIPSVSAKKCLKIWGINEKGPSQYAKGLKFYAGADFSRRTKSLFNALT